MVKRKSSEEVAEAQVKEVSVRVNKLHKSIVEHKHEQYLSWVVRNQKVSKGEEESAMDKVPQTKSDDDSEEEVVLSKRSKSKPAAGQTKPNGTKTIGANNHDKSSKQGGKLAEKATDTSASEDSAKESKVQTKEKEPKAKERRKSSTMNATFFQL